MAEPRGRPVRPVVVLDANVLIPRALRDLLLSLADAMLFRPVWQNSIVEEVERNYPKVAFAHRGADPKTSAEEIDRALKAMNRAFPDACLSTNDWIELVERMTCNAKDRHVLAAAVASGATHILTENTVDFPPASVPDGITVIRADAFLCELLEHDPEGVLDAVQTMCERWSRPAMTVAELAQKFANGETAPEFGTRLRDVIASMS